MDEHKRADTMKDNFSFVCEIWHGFWSKLYKKLWKRFTCTESFYGKLKNANETFSLKKRKRLYTSSKFRCGGTWFKIFFEENSIPVGFNLKTFTNSRRTLD